MDIEVVAHEIVDSAIQVHRALGPGLFESAYQRCLAHELRLRGVSVECEVLLPIFYRGEQIDAGYRIDMLVDDQIIIENKAVEQVLPVHKAQIITYLRLRDCRLGFLLNWNVPLMRQGIERFANKL